MTPTEVNAWLELALSWGMIGGALYLVYRLLGLLGHAGTTFLELNGVKLRK
jgi:hypothetical protein